jgi:V/A-type H+-transporting ATPase subunit A
MTEERITPHSERAQGRVVEAFGNLLHVAFEGSVRQGEVGFVDVEGEKLKAEVIEITGNIAKMQVFEETRGVRLETPVTFTGDLLEAELGPGLLTSIFDGLQSPLEKVARETGYFLERGCYIPALDRQHRWEFTPLAQPGAIVRRGSHLGKVPEGRFNHLIMVPFSLHKTVQLTWVAPAGQYTVEHVIAKGLDAEGKEHHFTMMQKWPVKMALVEGHKSTATKMMDTGCRIIDTQFPILKGGTFCMPGPFGAGKTVLQHHLAKYSSVDIVVMVACGERAGEVVEVLKEFPHLIDPHTGKSLMARTVIVCNTSSMPVAAREASIYLGITIAEYYRQMGLDILLLGDSTSRWAQAMREISARLEEIPGEEAFPAYLASRIAAFYERGGVVTDQHKTGSITIGGAVSPAGGNFEEPVTQATLAVVGAFLGLSRARSDARRYPAVDPHISWTKYIESVSRQLEQECPGWGHMVKRAARLLRDADEIGKRMEVVGEEGTPIDDLVRYLKGELYDFCYLQQNAFDAEDAYCPLSRQIPVFELISKIFDAQFDFASHAEARQYFNQLSNRLKNMNYLPFGSDSYRQAETEVLEMLQPAVSEV